LPFVLRTSRLLLRDFLPGDLGSLAAYRQDPLYQRYLPARPAGDADSRELLERFIGWQEEEPRTRFQLAIVLSSSGELIGSAGLRRRAPDSLVADLGFELAPSFWGHGYATEAARALVEYGFSELRLHRIHAHCIAENDASARVLERVGMRKEGVMRDHEFFRERWWDVHWYGMLESDFLEAR
jgi:[ribosomal protein S5]-alanine N-acetyltransferase